MQFALKRLTSMAVLTAVALTIFMIELQIPSPTFIPGVKLGLANIVTVYAMFTMGPAPTLLILLARIFLGGMFAGRMMSLLYSLSGGLLCYAVTLLMRRVVTIRQLWIASVIGAIFHNIGQMLMAIALLGKASVLVYLPLLMISGIVSGLLTGRCAQTLVTRLNITQTAGDTRFLG